MERNLWSKWKSGIFGSSARETHYKWSSAGGEEVGFDVDLVLIQVMRCITSLKCVLTQEHLDAVCAKYFVPEEVHPQLPSFDATMHERPAEMDLNAFIRTADPHASVGDGGDQGFDSVGGQDNIEPTVPVTEHVETETPGPKRTKKKRVTRGSERMPAASHPPKRLRADYGTTGVSATGASPLEEGGDHTDSATSPSLRTVGPSARRFGKNNMRRIQSVFGSTSSSEKNDRTLILFNKKQLNDGHILNGQMIDHFTPHCFPRNCTREWSHEQLFAEFNVSATRNLSLSSEVRMRAEYNILGKRKWRSLTEEKDCLLGAKDKEIEELKSQLLKAKEESVEVHELETSSTDLREKLEIEFPSTPPQRRCRAKMEGLAAGIEHGQAGRCLTDLEAYIPSAEELSNKKDASTWDIIDLLRLDDALAEALGSRSSLPLRSFNLYDPFPSASVTSYGAIHLGP
ncbi:hypothetical protein Tco_0616640 [Tanacetum coccineum]